MPDAPTDETPEVLDALAKKMANQQRLSVDAEVKALDDSEVPGAFEALAAVFGNVDKGGDRIKRGAFRNSLKRWRAKGDPLPIILSHDWGNPWSHIGVADPKSVKETPEGLMVRGHLDVDTNDVAMQVYRLMKRRSLTGWSFAYEIQDAEFNDGDGVYDLKELHIFEAGPTLRGMNPEAQLQAVKSAVLDEQKEQQPGTHDPRLPGDPPPTPSEPEVEPNVADDPPSEPPSQPKPSGDTDQDDENDDENDDELEGTTSPGTEERADHGSLRKASQRERLSALLGEGSTPSVVRDEDEQGESADTLALRRESQRELRDTYTQ